MTLPNGYTMQTTFVNDFAIADAFGVNAVKETYNRAFKEWKTNYIYLTELVVALNLAIWKWYGTRDDLAEVYDALWRKADSYACNHLKGEELSFFYQVTD